MAQYRFHLETLQRVREARRNELRVSFAEALRAEQVLIDRQIELAAEATALRELQRSAAAGRYLDVNRLLEVQRYEILLKAHEQELTKQKVLLAAEIERRRQALVESDRDVRVLERLDERHRHVFDQEQQRRESRTIDEVASHSWQAKQAQK